MTNISDTVSKSLKLERHGKCKIVQFCNEVNVSYLVGYRMFTYIYIGFFQSDRVKKINNRHINNRQRSTKME